MYVLVNNSNKNNANDNNMSSYMSSLQKRKTTKAKTKQQQQQQQQQQQDIEHNIGSKINASSEQNERLQLRTISNKLDAIRKQQQQIRTAAATTATTTVATSTSSTLYCNGTLPTTAILNLNCCRDINCRLNAPLSSAAAAAAAAYRANSIVGSSEESHKNTARQRQRSLSAVSSKSSSLEPAAAAAAASLQHSRDSCSPAHMQYAADSESSSDAITTTTKTSTTTTTTRREHTPAKREHVSTQSTSTSTDKTRFAADHGNAGAGIDTAAQFTIRLQVDLFSWALFLVAFGTRFHRLAQPAYIVFDELHYGKYISHYMRNTFFFDQHPPLGKQLVSAVVSLSGYDGNYTFTRIGAEYTAHVPIFWLRFVPALCGSLLPPAVYKLLLEAQLRRWAALLGGLLVILDNALLTQSRFVLMESMLLLFCTLGMYGLLKFQRQTLGSWRWFCYGVATAFSLGCAASVKYVGFLTLALAAYLMCRYLWNLLFDPYVTNLHIALHAVGRLLLFVCIPLVVYVGVFYVHLSTLYRAGPHDSIMTSAFQASLDGGLASITHGQPLNVVHGSQITLRHTHGRTCWLHSHAHVYPVRYPDKRGSSHQQQVTCYSFKDVNNWWIVKRPDRDDLVVGDEPDVIRHGDIIQLVHGITSRALNSHDVAAPMTPQCQEVTCYIDYEIKMAGELLWIVDILNRETDDQIWHAIKSEVRLVHKTTGAALRFSGRLLPDWGFNQHEVVADRDPEMAQKDTIWNVEEHRYTKTQDQRERELQLISAEMIPTKKTKLSFWAKFIELQTKMLWHSKQLQNHMYSSEPHEWPLLDKGIAYWLDTTSSAQIYLLGNLLIWYTGTISLLAYVSLGAFYLVRRRRLCYDLSACEWQRFLDIGDCFFVGYLIHYLPYFFIDHTLFLHHYLPAFLFKLLLLCFMLDHIDYLLRRYCDRALGLWLLRAYRLALLLWLGVVLAVFVKFLPLSYGTRQMTAKEVIALRWKDTWDFILQKNYALN